VLVSDVAEGASALASLGSPLAEHHVAAALTEKDLSLSLSFSLKGDINADVLLCSQSAPPVAVTRCACRLGDAGRADHGDWLSLGVEERVEIGELIRALRPQCIVGSATARSTPAARDPDAGRRRAAVFSIPAACRRSASTSATRWSRRSAPGARSRSIAAQRGTRGMSAATQSASRDRCAVASRPTVSSAAWAESRSQAPERIRPRCLPLVRRRAAPAAARADRVEPEPHARRRAARSAPIARAARKPPRDVPVPVGTVLDKYRLEEVLGPRRVRRRLPRDAPLLRTPVAIKMLLPKVVEAIRAWPRCCARSAPRCARRTIPTSCAFGTSATTKRSTLHRDGVRRGANRCRV
jgi:hypothetical protein